MKILDSVDIEVLAEFLLFFRAGQGPSHNHNKPRNQLFKIVNFLWRKFIVLPNLFIHQRRLKDVKTVIFASDYTHLQQQEIIYHELSRRNYKTQFLTTRYNLLKSLRKVDSSASSIFVSSEDANELTLRKVISRYLMNNEHLSITKETIMTCRAAINLYSAIYHHLAYSIPRFAIVGNDLTYEGRLFVLCCRKLGIKTAAISHGLSDINDRMSEILVDYYFCWGQIEFHRLVNVLGISPNRIVVSGSPFIEFKKANKQFLDDVAIKEFIQRLPGDFKVLIALSGPGHATSYSHHQMIVKCLLLLVRALKSVNFIFKLHTKDSKSNYSLLANEENVTVLSKGEYKLNYQLDKWLSYTDLLITGSSSSGIDAMLRSIPVITLDLVNEYSLVTYIKEGASRHCTSFDELYENTRKLILDTEFREAQVFKQNQYISKYFYMGKESPSEIICSTIEKHLN